MRLDSRSTVAAAALLGVAVLMGGTSVMAASGTGEANGTSVTPIAISGGDDTDGLKFGKFSTVSGTGTITINPQNNVISHTGDLDLRTSDAQPATFTVTGEANATYAITLPAGGDVNLDEDGAGTATIPLTAFTAYSQDADTLGTTGSLIGGSDTLKVGATANVDAADPQGTYSGTFTVVVEYN